MQFILFVQSLPLLAEPCARSLCPFAHRGERARRRPLGQTPPPAPLSAHGGSGGASSGEREGAPSQLPYSCVLCPAVRRPGGVCPRGDACLLAHNTFERCEWDACRMYALLPTYQPRACDLHATVPCVHGGVCELV
jgi:hypothetical protein